MADSQTTLQEEAERLRVALIASRQALDDWLHVYASDLCDESRVKEADTRIRAAGGILAYIASVQGENRKALQNVQ